MGKKISRGRGNQGDWVSSPYQVSGELPSHKSHNAAVEAKKQLKKQRKAKEKS